MPGPLQQHRQRADVVGAEHDVHPRRLAHDRLAVLLGQAAADGDLHARVRELARPQVPEVAVELVVGVLPDRARVEHDDVRGRRVVRARVARGLQQPGHPLGVVHVHLAPVRAEGVAATHGSRVDALDHGGRTRHDAPVELTRRQVLRALGAAGLTRRCPRAASRFARRAAAHRDRRHGGRVLPAGAGARAGVAGAAGPDDGAGGAAHQRLAGERDPAGHRCRGRGRQPARRRRGPDRGQLVAARAGRGLQRRPADRRPGGLADPRGGRTSAAPGWRSGPRTPASPTWPSGCSPRRGSPGPERRAALPARPRRLGGRAARGRRRRVLLGRRAAHDAPSTSSPPPCRCACSTSNRCSTRCAAATRSTRPAPCSPGTYRIADPVATLLVRNVLLVDADARRRPGRGPDRRGVRRAAAPRRRDAGGPHRRRPLGDPHPARRRCTTARCAGSPTTRWPDGGLSGPRVRTRPHPPGPGSAAGARCTASTSSDIRSIAASKNAAPCSLNGCRWPTQLEGHEAVHPRPQLDEQRRRAERELISPRSAPARPGRPARRRAARASSRRRRPRRTAARAATPPARRRSRAAG